MSSRALSAAARVATTLVLFGALACASDSSPGPTGPDGTPTAGTGTGTGTGTSTGTGTGTSTGTGTGTTSGTAGRWITGYYAGYQRNLYPETSVDFTYLTHIVVAAVQVTAAGGLDTTFYTDPAQGPGMARTLTARAHQFNRKAIMMIGGAGGHDLLLNATSSSRRAQFVADLVKVMNGYGFDGIDVDWEPVVATDEPQILQFLRDLRAAKPGLIITFPAEWVNTNFGADPWYTQVAALVDQFNVMSYDMAGNWGGWASWHSSALFGEGANHPSSVSASASAYLKVGVPAEKLGVGVGAYGDCWQGVNAMLRPLDNTSADVYASDNDMSYINIVQQYYRADAFQWDSTAHMGYLTFASGTGPRRCTMVSYDDPRSLADKGAYIKSQGLGGVIMWTINQQHMPNAAADAQDPLLKALGVAMR